MITLGLSPLSRRGDATESALRSDKGGADHGVGGDEHATADVERGRGAAVARVIFAWTRAHGRRFYDFEGLDSFKAKFRPSSWEGVHLVLSADSSRASRHEVINALVAVGGAFGGTSTARFGARVLWHALRSEALDLTSRVSRMLRP